MKNQTKVRLFSLMIAVVMFFCCMPLPVVATTAIGGENTALSDLLSQMTASDADLSVNEVTEEWKYSDVHTLGVGELPYHEVPDGETVCRNAALCCHEDCQGENGRPGWCIMDDGWREDWDSEMFCSDCKSEIMTHLQTRYIQED